MDKAENSHPADRLAEVRSEIKRLQSEESDLRTMIIEMAEQERAGRRHKATVKIIRGKRLDTDLIRAAMPAEWIADHERETEVTMVKLAELGARK